MLPPPGGILPPAGSVPLPPPYIPPPTGVAGPGTVSGPVATTVRILNGKYVEGYYQSDGLWVTTRIIGAAPGIVMPADTVGIPIGSGSTVPYTSFTAPSPTRISQLYGSPTGFAEGGIADRPTFGMFGEGHPEAFVPLKGGAILVRFAANQNRPTKSSTSMRRWFISWPSQPAMKCVKVRSRLRRCCVVWQWVDRHGDRQCAPAHGSRNGRAGRPVVQDDDTGGGIR